MTNEEAIERLKRKIEWIEDGALCSDYGIDKEVFKLAIKALEKEPTPQPKIGHCKDCKWWKDSDGIFRRGFDAESQCPMNRIEVFEGNGYCYMFEPQKSEK